MAEETQGQAVVEVPTTPPITYFDTPQTPTIPTIPTLPTVPTMPDITAYRVPSPEVTVTLYTSTSQAGSSSGVDGEKINEAQPAASYPASGETAAPSTTETGALSASTTVAEASALRREPAYGELIISTGGVALGLFLAVLVVALVRRRAV